MFIISYNSHTVIESAVNVALADGANSPSTTFSGFAASGAINGDHKGLCAAGWLLVTASAGFPHGWKCNLTTAIVTRVSVVTVRIITFADPDRNESQPSRQLV